MKSEYSMQDILKKSMEANMEKKKRVEEEMNADTAGKRITRNQILKSCEQEENFKYWKKEMLKEAKKTETKLDDNYVSCLTQTNEMFKDILYDEGTTLDESMPDFGTLSKYM